MTMICMTAPVRDASDCATYIRQGGVIGIGRPNQIFGKPEHPEMQKSLASVR
ncbi:hypothetical protein RsS62_11470 [Rhizobium dioscoreae]|uniref:hypothetical protein n=1 Tax=Rhizobium TaxID=379 RepID=UPI00119B1A01|nr:MULTISPECIES: hypothetical protein [Rhizobium]TWB12726.1 hypothetical protein FBZ99_106285 [Rhizobium sp. ERR1071]GES41895.1 hypothetical protein RsS62_11470 [Rhizobium dioscoreae]